MTFIIRVDASSEIGTGHVMRCLTLANVLKKNGEKVAFISKKYDGNLISFCLKNGFKIYSIPKYLTAHKKENSDPYYLSQKEDAAETINIINKNKLSPKCVIVDHYGISLKWERLIRPHTKTIFVIDDLFNRKHDCDFLLNQNYLPDMASKYNNLIPANTKTFFSPRYALLRDEFKTQIAKKSLKKEDSTFNIFVFFGGSDTVNMTEKVIQAINFFKNTTENKQLKNNLIANIVVGANNNKKKEIELLCKKNDYLKYHYNISNISEIMKQTDIAIGAGGSTTWERCAIGLPSIVVTIAKNQEETTKYCAEKEVLNYLGKAENITIECIARAINELILSPSKRSAFSKKSMDLVDGNGADHIYSQLNRNL